jgi:hypothetical protein
MMFAGLVAIATTSVFLIRSNQRRSAARRFPTVAESRGLLKPASRPAEISRELHDEFGQIYGHRVDARSCWRWRRGSPLRADRVRLPRSRRRWTTSAAVPPLHPSILDSPAAISTVISRPCRAFGITVHYERSDCRLDDSTAIHVTACSRGADQCREARRSPRGGSAQSRTVLELDIENCGKGLLSTGTGRASDW